MIEICEESDANSDIRIIWRNLSYTVTNSWLHRKILSCQGIHVPSKKVILRKMNGEIRSGELVAFVGPSGAGKSTLMECVLGKRIEGRTGDVIISGDQRNFKVAFVAQKNTFLTQLTVRETIHFAAKLKIYCDKEVAKVHSNVVSTYCSDTTDQLIADLGLQECAHNRVANCSGGQLKRLAIAQEVIVKPRVLMLDEPTSGLDSASCLIVVSFLKKLTQQTPKSVVLATIHQPSIRVLNLFDKMYAIAANSDCIYEEHPLRIAEVLAKYDLFLPPQYNPADFLMEIASDDEKKEEIAALKFQHQLYYDSQFQMPPNSTPLSQVHVVQNIKYSTQIRFLTTRCLIATFRDPLIIGLRLASTILVVIYLTNLFGTDIGLKGGCPPKFNADFEPSQLDEIGDEIEAEMKTIYNNTGNILFILLFAMFNSLMLTCLTFPTEMIVFKTEKENLWYKTSIFYVSKMISEIPIQLLSLLLLFPPIYFLQHQSPDLWRFSLSFLILLLDQLISQTTGYIMGALFMNNIPASVFLGPVAGLLPLMLLCGVFIRIKSMNAFFRAISYLSYLRFTMEALLITVYGFNRCGLDASKKLLEGKEAFIVWFSAMLGVYDDENGGDSETDFANSTDAMSNPSEKFVEEFINTMTGDFISKENVVRSITMNAFDLQDWHLYFAISALFVHLIVLRLIAYFIICRKVKSNN